MDGLLLKTAYNILIDYDKKSKQLYDYQATNVLKSWTKVNM